MGTLEEENVKAMAVANVEKINLSQNENLLFVPDFLVSHGLTNLQHLDLSRCLVSMITAHQTWNLPNLLTLDLSHNRLKEFPSKSVLKGVPLLQKLDLYGNRLMSLPDFTGRSETQQISSNGSPETSGEFGLDGGGSNHSSRPQNQLQQQEQEPDSKLPPAAVTNRRNSGDHVAASRRNSASSRRNSGDHGAVAARRNSLKTAHANNPNNRSKSWKESGVLTHLITLNVGYNDLTCLPDGLPPSLKTLIASNNFLSSVPKALVMGNELYSSNTTTTTTTGGDHAVAVAAAAEQQTTSSTPVDLKELDVTSNPIQFPPPEICESGLRVMRKWFRENSEAAQQAADTAATEEDHSRQTRRSSFTRSRRGSSPSKTNNHKNDASSSSTAAKSVPYKKREGHLAKKHQNHRKSSNSSARASSSDKDVADSMLEMLG